MTDCERNDESGYCHSTKKELYFRCCGAIPHRKKYFQKSKNNTCISVSCVISYFSVRVSVANSPHCD